MAIDRPLAIDDARSGAQPRGRRRNWRFRPSFSLASVSVFLAVAHARKIPRGPRDHSRDYCCPELGGHPVPSAQSDPVLHHVPYRQSVSGFGPGRHAFERHVPAMNNDQGGAIWIRSDDNRSSASVFSAGSARRYCQIENGPIPIRSDPVLFAETNFDRVRPNHEF
jgi:hypothetical protein